MAAEPPIVHGISSRRSACDRCRSLKLRCPRNNPSNDPCHRCTRAEVACIISPTYRLRAHFRRRATTVSRTAHASLSPEHSLATELVPPSVFSGTGHERASQVSASDLDPWHPSLSWPLGSLSACTGDSLPAVTPAPASFPDSTFDMAWPTTPISNENQPLPPVSKQIPSPPAESDREDASRSHEWDLDEDELDSCSASCSGRSLDLFERADGDETPTADLSRANLSLAKQLDQIRRSASAVTLEVLVAPLADSHVSHPSGMIKATHDFLQVLRSLTGRHGTPTEMTANPTVRAQTHRRPPNMLGSGSSHSLDSTEALLVLSSYIHLLRIYVVQFEAICRLLQDVADSSFPSLDFACGRPISGYQSTKRNMWHPRSKNRIAHRGHLPQSGHHLQATLFIHMAINLFGQAEKLIGLPSELRIDQDTRNTGGLLSDHNFDSFIACIISKEDSSTTGGVSTLRNSVKRAHKLLRDHIMP
jgi:hypothetical protein